MSSLFVLDELIPDDRRSRTPPRVVSANTHADVKVSVAKRAIPTDDCDMSVDTVVGIVGGTGLYDLPGLTDRAWRKIDSPFGAPSDEVLLGRLDGRPIAFLPRHGRGHRIPPHEINFLANIDALKRAGATSLVSRASSTSAVVGE